MVLKVKYFDRLVDKLYNLKWITAKDADEAKKEYFKFITPVQNEHKDAFLTFDEFDELTFVWICSFVILCMVTPSLENAGMSLSSYLLYLTDRLL